MQGYELTWYTGLGDSISKRVSTNAALRPRREGLATCRGWADRSHPTQGHPSRETWRERRGLNELGKFGSRLRVGPPPQRALRSVRLFIKNTAQRYLPPYAV